MVIRFAERCPASMLVAAAVVGLGCTGSESVAQNGEGIEQRRILQVVQCVMTRSPTKGSPGYVKDAPDFVPHKASSCPQVRESWIAGGTKQRHSRHVRVEFRKPFHSKPACTCSAMIPQTPTVEELKNGAMPSDIWGCSVSAEGWEPYQVHFRIYSRVHGEGPNRDFHYLFPPGIKEEVESGAWPDFHFVCVAGESGW